MKKKDSFEELVILTQSESDSIFEVGFSVILLYSPLLAYEAILLNKKKKYVSKFKKIKNIFRNKELSR